LIPSPAKREKVQLASERRMPEPEFGRSGCDRRLIGQLQVNMLSSIFRRSGRRFGAENAMKPEIWSPDLIQSDRERL